MIHKIKLAIVIKILRDMTIERIFSPRVIYAIY